MVHGGDRAHSENVSCRNRKSENLLFLGKMKTVFIKYIFVIAIAMVTGINVFNAQKSEMLSDVVLANVEALATGEDVDMRRGYILVEKNEKCSVCEWTGGDNDYCNVHEQLPDCY